MTVTICDYDSLYVNRQTGEGVSQEKFNNDEHTTSGDENSGNRVASGVSVTLAGKIYRRRPGNSEKLSTVSRNREADKGPIKLIFLLALQFPVFICIAVSLAMGPIFRQRALPRPAFAAKYLILIDPLPSSIFLCQSPRHQPPQPLM